MLKIVSEVRKIPKLVVHSSRNIQIEKSPPMRLAYELYSPPGDKEQNLPPVMMMHGMLDSKKGWKLIAPHIAERTGRKVYAVDARNHGNSPWDDEISFDINANDLTDFLASHRIPKASIVGHSMGGRTAIALALHKPELVEKIVVEDMNLRNFKPDQSGILVQTIWALRESLNHIPSGADERTAKKSIVRYLTSLFEEMTGKPASKQDGQEKKSKGYELSMMPLRRDGDGYCWEANLDVIEKMLTTERIRQDLGGVFTGDALFLYGTKSFFKVDKDRQIPIQFPRSSLVGIERATHLLHYEFPDRFIEEVSSFLNSGLQMKAKI